MANTKSAIKRNRQTVTRTERNRAEKSRMKSARKKALAAIETGDKDEASKAASELRVRGGQGCETQPDSSEQSCEPQEQDREGHRSD